MTAIDQKFLAKMGDSFLEAAPGICIQAYASGKKILDVECGKTYAYYDWASVTKIVFTATSLMMLHDQGLFKITDKISKWVPWFPREHPARLKDLLCHSAGMVWWHPFYKTMMKKDRGATPESAWAVFQEILRKQILKDLSKQTAAEIKSPKTVYSDLDLFLLGIAMESISGRTMYELWQTANDRMNLTHANFNRANKPVYKRSLYAPTENDTTFRHRVIQGEVHDQNTWAMGGVAPHAGLFGPIDDLSSYGLLLRGAMLGKKSKRFASPAVTSLFTRRAIPRANGDWALDFMMPSKTGASCGELFSQSSVGHLGFTGTSLWFDPKKDLLVTVLSNRIHPTVENIEIRKLRPKIHTWIAEEL